MASRGTSNGAAGFDGVVERFGWLDLVRLNAANRFVGSIAVEHDSGSGILFFRDGQVVHAEAGGARGEAAFFEIMRWPAGRYAVNAEEEAPGVSITRGLGQLLADAGRAPGEGSREVTAPLPRAGAAPPPPQRRDGSAAVVEAIRRIPGVECALVHGKDGGRTSTGGIACPAAPIEKESVALSRLAKRLGELFRTGDLVAGTVQGSDRNVLLLAIRDSQLTVLVAAGSDAGAVEDRIRALLGARG